MDVSSVDEMRDRLPEFRRLSSELGEPCILSHKVRMWLDGEDDLISPYQLPAAYVVSIHALSFDDFDFVTFRDLPTITNRSDLLLRELWDYRDTAATRRDNQRSFSGHDFTVDREVREVDRGFLARTRVGHIDAEDRYYPGLHQNLILPQYEIRWEPDTYRLRLPLLSFRWKLIERLAHERTLRPFEYQTIRLCHTRSAIFAPHVVRRAERE